LADAESEEKGVPFEEDEVRKMAPTDCHQKERKPLMMLA
jgi:hypothetical protein